MEKKLTDEEVVKALGVCTGIEGTNCTECPYYEKKIMCYRSKRKEKDALDLIHRLQAEIERLTEENGYLDGCAKQFLADYQKCEIERAEIQKQVDELKEELEKAYETERANIRAEIADAGTSCHWCERQTVKDTAKEIYNELKTEVISVDIPRGGEPPEEGCEAVLWWKIEEHFKKKYGVNLINKELQNG